MNTPKNIMSWPFALNPVVGANFKHKFLFCTDEARILDSLPYNMKRDVALAVHITTLSKVSGIPQQLIFP